MSVPFIVHNLISLIVSLSLIINIAKQNLTYIFISHLLFSLQL